MPRVRKSFWIICFLMEVSFAADLIPDPVAGAETAKSCVMCHGLEGNSTVPAWPKIAASQ